ncbi:MAG: bifunctional folylpolyglutamate synthase/dihydrofolate synthase [Verrucomicrobia bacterium]|nr:bifunctional folylpolyglutamate synthase/dihydrofolate synthase [Verrucomicrobiota bacterium]
MTYSEAIEFLYGLRLFGAKFGLENTFKLTALADNPQRKLRFIHVAGTNGKGSTCAMLESIYRHAGLRTGLFTSPHLVKFGERIQINRQLLSEAHTVRLVEEMQPLLAQFSREQHPTFFEVVTVMALRFFAENQCDLVIFETGLGGRLDATNIVTPLASVITNIGLDHQQWLGDTHKKIAAEKAGIIKRGVPVLTTTDVPGAFGVIEAKAHGIGAPLVVVGHVQLSTFNFQLSLSGEHQRVNAALALATVETLQEKIPVSAEAIRRGLAHVDWPGRLQIVKTSDGRTFLLDGAHNPPGCEALSRALEQLFPNERAALLLGMLADKDCAPMCARLAPLADRVCLVPVASGRTAKPEELLPHCRAANPSAEISVCASVRDAVSLLTDRRFVVVTGSLYLVGEVMELLGVSVSSRDERGLNEWR